MQTDAIVAWAMRRGYRVAWGPWEAVEDARRELRERRAAGDLDATVDREFLAPLESRLPAAGDAPAWVILVLVPRPAHAVTFLAGGRSLVVMIPPTYVRFRAVAEEVIGDIGTSVFEGRAAVERLPLLLKAAAARLGLVDYGRNNVAYAEGFGSYFQIVGGYTGEDLSEGAATPRAPRQMDLCESCGACGAACPTGAIGKGRFLLDAGRCLVTFNERVEEIPPWVPGTAHKCFVGCMLCQRVCPANAGSLRTEDSGLVFTEEETRSVLDPATPTSDASMLSTGAKLAALGITEEPDPLWRNLRLLFQANGWPLPTRDPWDSLGGGS